MIRPAALSLESVRDADHGDLIEQIESVLAVYDKPEGLETEKQRIERLSRTLDEIPAVYRWLLQLKSWCWHWTQAYGKQFGKNDVTTDRMRQRKDLLDDMASSAKTRYESASRELTLIIEFNPMGMPRTRSG